MQNRNNRMNTLDNAGIDTSKYYNVAIDKALPKGTTLMITIGENGLPTVTATELKGMLDQIDSQGYVKNSNLFRRWVMAQTFRMMKHEGGYTAALNEKPYKYQWTMVENELHAMSKIEKEDKELFKVRKDFFTKEVIIAMLEDYKAKLNAECRGIHLVWAQRKHTEGIAIANITIDAIKQCTNYNGYYQIIREFNKELKGGRRDGYYCPDLTLSRTTVKCKEWIDAYKGAGAYYSLQNYLRFHADTHVYLPTNERGRVLWATRLEAEGELEVKREEYKGQWYKLFGYFKRVIELNQFDFDQAMHQKYHESVQF